MVRVSRLQESGIYRRGFFRELQPHTSNLFQDRCVKDHCKSAASVSWFPPVVPTDMLWTSLAASISTLPVILVKHSARRFYSWIWGLQHGVRWQKRELISLPKTWEVIYDLSHSCPAQPSAPQLEQMDKGGSACAHCVSQGLQQLQHSVVWPTLPSFFSA